MIISTVQTFSVASRFPLVPRWTYFRRTMRVLSLNDCNRDPKKTIISRANFSSVAARQDFESLISQEAQRSSIINPIAGNRIRNLQEFVDRIPTAVRLRKNGKNEPGTADDPVAQLFRQVDLSPSDWQKYALFDNDKPYTRNLISTDHETFTLLLLCWNPGQESPIHDHPCDGCWLKVLKGGVQEIRYDEKLNPILQIDCRKGGLSYITDNLGYHKVGNPTRIPAVTLHLYAPPFESCRCWNSERDDPSKPLDGKTINHSEYGILKAA